MKREFTIMWKVLLSLSGINLILAKTVVPTLHSGEVASIKLEEDFATAHIQSEKLLAKFF